jgi:5'-3' exonuclease
MGIHKFFPWFKSTFRDNITMLGKNEKLGVEIDNFMIDLNGIFHTSAQKIYEYGSHKPTQSFLKKKKIVIAVQDSKIKQLKVFKDVCKTIEILFQLVSPKKRLILCVDGPAPQSKQKQQRQRRFKSAMENSDCVFDSNCITPGTKFMDYLTKYIDWYIRKKISDQDSEISQRSWSSGKAELPENNTAPCSIEQGATSHPVNFTEKKLEKIDLWKSVQIIFSNEKVPGEGEHNCFDFVRKNITGKDESYCIHGLDSDLVMLSLSTHLEKFYILREDQFDKYNDFYFIDMGGVSKELFNLMSCFPVSSSEDETFTKLKSDKLKREKEKEKIKHDIINDFILICFMVGNDFLPSIPSLDILTGGIDTMIEIYRNVYEKYGSLTEKRKDGVFFKKKSMEIMLKIIGNCEKDLLEEKLNCGDKFFQDSILEKNTIVDQKGISIVDIEKYRENYYKENFKEAPLISSAGKSKELPLISIPLEQRVAHDYLEGMQWVLSYYTMGVSNWKWFYPHHYAPFAYDIGKHLSTFEFVKYSKTFPNLPFQQLLCVLPPKSLNLIPSPLNSLLEENSPLKKYYPNEFKIDTSGKKREYEGVVLLPFINQSLIENEYNKLISKVDEKESRRNKIGKSFVYKYTPESSKLFQSHYGDILNCRVVVSLTDL